MVDKEVLSTFTLTVPTDVTKVLKPTVISAKSLVLDLTKKFPLVIGNPEFAPIPTTELGRLITPDVMVFVKLTPLAVLAFAAIFPKIVAGALVNELASEPNVPLTFCPVNTIKSLTLFPDAVLTRAVRLFRKLLKLDALNVTVPRGVTAEPLLNLTLPELATSILKLPPVNGTSVEPVGGDDGEERLSNAVGRLILPPVIAPVKVLFIGSEAERIPNAVIRRFVNGKDELLLSTLNIPLVFPKTEIKSRI